MFNKKLAQLGGDSSSKYTKYEFANVNDFPKPTHRSDPSMLTIQLVDAPSVDQLTGQRRMTLKFYDEICSNESIRKEMKWADSHPLLHHKRLFVREFLMGSLPIQLSNRNQDPHSWTKDSVLTADDLIIAHGYFPNDDVLEKALNGGIIAGKPKFQNEVLDPDADKIDSDPTQPPHVALNRKPFRQAEVSDEVSEPTLMSSNMDPLANAVSSLARNFMDSKELYGLKTEVKELRMEVKELKTELKNDIRNISENISTSFGFLTSVLNSALFARQPHPAQMSSGSGFRSPTQQSPEQGEKTPEQ
eukprot:g4147.t1